MVYCKEKNLLFIHIPKNAGTSTMHRVVKRNRVVNMVTFKKKKANRIFYYYFYRRWFRKIIQKILTWVAIDHNIICGFSGNLVLQHLTYQQVETMYPQVIENKPTTFAIKRNPYDRMISIYRYSCEGYMSFKKMVKYIAKEMKKRKMEDRACFHIAQTDFIYNDKDELLVDRVLAYENLNEDWANFTRDYNLDLEELPTLNITEKKSPKSISIQKIKTKSEDGTEDITEIRVVYDDKMMKKFRKYYTPELIEMVGEMYDRDFKLLGYSKELNLD